MFIYKNTIQFQSAVDWIGRGCAIIYDIPDYPDLVHQHLLHLILMVG